MSGAPDTVNVTTAEQPSAHPLDALHHPPQNWINRATSSKLAARNVSPMHLTFLGKDSDGGESPTLYATEDAYID